MNTPRSHHRPLYLAIAVLLASMTTGYIGFCDIVANVAPSDADTLYVSLRGGEQDSDLISAYGNTVETGSYRFALCSPAPEGVYTVTHLSPTLFTAGVATSSNTPPGHYVMRYAYAADFCPGDPFGCFGVSIGWVDLTVTASTLAACFNFTAPVHAGSDTYLNATCSVGSIDTYSWWFDYNGDPSSPPSKTGSDPEVSTIFTVGEHLVRLLVHATNGQEASVTRVVYAGLAP